MSGSRGRGELAQTVDRPEGEGVTVLQLARPLSLPLWMIPAIYVAVSVAAGLIGPRLEHAYLARHAHDMSAAAAIAWFSAVASGSMAFTGVVFAVTFVVVQFGAVAYSPRLVTMFARTPRLYHTLGLFFATFTYALAALAWTDRNGQGATPLISTYVVGVLLILSMLAFALLIQAICELQIQNVLQQIGSRGRAVIAAMFASADEGAADGGDVKDILATLPPERGVFTYAGTPLAVAKFDLDRLVGAAEAAGVVIVVECAVGDTLVEGSPLYRVHGGHAPPDERALRQAICLAMQRTFEQDPKYAIRLLVDVAIRALSPAVNDPTTAVQALDQIEDLLRRLGRSRLDAGHVRDQAGVVRVIVPTPTWTDYLSLAFDEIRQYGAQSVQVVRRLRAALNGLAAGLPAEERRAAVRRCLDHLDDNVRRSTFDEQDRASGMREDRQGLGLARERA